MKASNVLLDTENNFTKENNYPNAIYPAIYNIKGDKVIGINYISPQNSMALEDLKAQLKEEPFFNIDLESYIKNGEHNKKIKLSDITDSIIYMPLKTTYNLPVAEIQGIRMTEEFIYCLDTRQNLFCFDHNGDFITLIGKRGEGPEEYLNIADFDVDAVKKEIYLFDLQRHSILIYDLEGNFIRRIKLSDNILNIARYYNSQFIVYAPQYLGNENEKLIFFDDNGEKKDSISFLQNRNSNNTKTDLFKMAVFKFYDPFTFQLPFSDIVYALTPIGNQYKYIELQQGEYKLPYNIGSNTKSYNKNLDSPYIFEPYVQKYKNVLFINFFFKMNNYRVLYDLSNKSFHTIFKGKYPVGIENDIDGSSPFWPIYIKDEWAVGIANFNDTKHDNPVLQIIRYKSKRDE